MDSVVNVSVNSFTVSLTNFLKHLPILSYLPSAKAKICQARSLIKYLPDGNNLPDILPASHVFRLLFKSVGLSFPKLLDLLGLILLLAGPVPGSDGDGCVLCSDSDRPCVLGRKHGDGGQLAGDGVHVTRSVLDKSWHVCHSTCVQISGAIQQYLLQDYHLVHLFNFWLT